MTRKFNCPSCKEKTGVEIDSGCSNDKLAQPSYRCLACGFEWDKDKQFQEAVKRWLDEDVQGRSWTQMMDDKDKADDEKVKTLLTPEYLAIWAKAKKSMK
ncbi:hypothetical protein LZG75_12025 [Polynucleobacter sp. IMCC30063]|uniref:hypothetical protein n=1 Tax=Polynucleobacter sp. IMCC30063 TaxID=2907298 RepID=UPI001F232306|nr:hypothetical protein [Polynucleobacter sp. IMCC30063]MCE7506956.1 hypothetical protein [Polynucleobacter sp. IMCC30063]